MKKKVLVLGASGLIGPNLTSGLEPYYDLLLTDIAPHPDGKAITACDITSFEQVRQAAQGMDAIINATVNRSHPDHSFHVNTKGARNVMQAAAELGIKKVIHTGPQFVRGTYDHDFNVVDVPRLGGINYYVLTKMLASEICQIYARTHGIQTVSFVFNGLGPRPTEKVTQTDFPPFTVVWEDLQLACRLALELESVPDDFQEFNMLSYVGHGKYSIEKAKRILGFEPTQQWERYFERTP
jgi:nucleoside-diphosphate-sugar epimerase